LKVYLPLDQVDQLDDQNIVRSLRIESEDVVVEIDVTYDLVLVIDDTMEINKTEDEYQISIDKDTVFISMSNATQDITDAVKFIVSILSNRKASVEQTYMEAFDAYNQFVTVPSWTIEIICSQLIRDSDNPMYPYRLSNMKNVPLKINLKDVSLYENWKRASAFENVSKALHSQILNPNRSGEVVSSDLDQLLTL
jgi:hypothetical protein